MLLRARPRIDELPPFSTPVEESTLLCFPYIAILPIYPRKSYIWVSSVGRHSIRCFCKRFLENDVQHENVTYSSEEEVIACSYLFLSTRSHFVDLSMMVVTCDNDGGDLRQKRGVNRQDPHLCVTQIFDMS
jgi:hypothetical protein